jgi:beta-phosphoglucomutase
VSASPPRAAVIFDLDGVLTDTAELHFRSWLELARDLAIPFDRAANEALRGLSRAESLRRFLGSHVDRFTPEQQAEIMARKNAAYVARVARLGPGDLLPGAAELLAGLRAAGAPLAVASSSRNAGLVLDRLGIRARLDVLVDGNDVTRSKPDPELFLTAARRLNMPPQRCLVVEDAESGVAAALAAGMRVIGIGPPARVGRAHRVVAALTELDPAGVLAVLPA